MKPRLLVISLLLSGFLGADVANASDPTAPPRAGYVGRISQHLLAGDTGTSSYHTIHGWRVAKLAYEPTAHDDHYWQYTSDSPRYPRWAFAKHPIACGRCPVFVLIHVSNGVDPPHKVWRRVEDALRILEGTP